ncbi:MAG: 1-acyl-sn-glycerol-3-phosphate acyltransferase [Clostridia bacterium]|nr:1-acyl-sn-glycerol-3-phosphate acyltransferase [Clostridia bacterium]
MMFDPKPTRYPFPKYTDRHYLVVKKNNGAVFDGDYPYVDESRPFRFKQALTRLALNLLVFSLASVRLGLKIRGRENVKKNRELLKKGVVSCANHVHLWDYICVMKAIRPFRSNLLAWDVNVRGENAGLIRMVGGIPIPVGDPHASVAFAGAIRKLLDKGGWLHVYAEGSMWEFYAPIRPFKTGAAYFAVQCDKPVLPMAFSYREPGFVRKKIFRQDACFTLSVGEPLFPDKTLPRRERVTDLTARMHDSVCRLAGIDPAENIYPAVFDNSTRVDYYDIPNAESL